MERIDTDAIKILKQELKEEWDDETYEEIRLYPNFYGFTSTYLLGSANYEEFSSSAKSSTILKLAKLDLQRGTSIPELAFSFCRHFPKKEAIESLIAMGKETESEEKLIERILTFQNQNG